MHLALWILNASSIQRRGNEKMSMILVLDGVFDVNRQRWLNGTRSRDEVKDEENAQKAHGENQSQSSAASSEATKTEW